MTATAAHTTVPPDLPESLREALVPPLRLTRPRDLEPARPPVGGRPTGSAQQGTLALRFPLPSGRPSEVDTDAGLRLRLASYQSRLVLDPDDRDAPTARAALPDPRPWCARLVQAAIEAIVGDRPVAQLHRWTSRDVFESISHRAAPSLARTAVRRRSSRPLVRSVHLDEPSDGVVEACATVHDGSRARAVVVRLEGLGGRWVCTALHLV